MRRFLQVVKNASAYNSPSNAFNRDIVAVWVMVFDTPRSAARTDLDAEVRALVANAFAEVFQLQVAYSEGEVVLRDMMASGAPGAS